MGHLSFPLECLFSFLAIMNPIGNTPVFLSLVNYMPESEKLRIAKVSVIFAFLVVFVFTIGGNIIFRIFGITLPAFRIAGGILVFMIAYNLVRARRSHQHHPTEEEHPSLPGSYEEYEERGAEDVAITPLGTPILAGPGTITTALSLVGKKADIFTIGTVIVVFACVCLLTYLCFIYGELIEKKLKPSHIGIMTRLMGLILAVVAIQMIIEGIGGAIPQIIQKH